MKTASMTTRRNFLCTAGLAVGSPLITRLARAAGASPEPNFPPLEKITVGGMEIRPSAPPKSLHNRSDLGILLNRNMAAQRIYAPLPPNDYCGEARAVKSPGGDYLVMLAAGKHHFDWHDGAHEKLNDMLAFRSSDGGKTWSGPAIAWNIPYNQHGFVPLIPRGTKRIYAFGTQPIFSEFNEADNAPIGARHSDDDGHTWTDVSLIRPVNDPGFRGMNVIPGCETAQGTWLLAPHTSEANHPTVKNGVYPSHLYVMRSADRGESWTLLPHARPNGWVTSGQYRSMEEGSPVALGGGGVLLLARTGEGCLWELRSHDDGRTWTTPKPTPLVHPYSPAMLFHLNDGKGLIVLFHNRFTGHANFAFDRSELWASVSHDEGHTWSEPRFLLANSAGGGTQGGFGDWCVSYQNLLAEQGQVHLFFSHQFRQVLHVTFREEDLFRFPTKQELGKAISAGAFQSVAGPCGKLELG